MDQNGNFEVCYTGGLTETFADIDDALEFMEEVGACDLWYEGNLLRSRIHNYLSGEFEVEDFLEEYAKVGLDVPA